VGRGALPLQRIESISCSFSGEIALNSAQFDALSLTVKETLSTVWAVCLQAGENLRTLPSQGHNFTYRTQERWI